MGEEMVQAVTGAWSDAMLRMVVWGSLVLAVAGWAERQVEAGSTALRLWIWRVSYIKLVFLLAGIPTWTVVDFGDVTWGLSGGGRGSVGHGGFAGNHGEPASRISEPSEVGNATGNAMGNATAKDRWGLEAVIRIAFALWVAGFGVAVFRLLRQMREAGAWLRGAQPLRNGGQERWIDQWFRENSAGQSRWVSRVRVLLHPKSGGPRVMGIWRPKILLPAGFLSDWDERERRSVLAHEWGHVSGGDLAWRWLRAWMKAVFFFHPLLAWADRRSTLSEEVACDRAAMREGGLSPSAYARVLIRTVKAEMGKVAVGFPMAEAGMTRQAEGLRERIEALSAATADGGWRWRRRGLVVVLALVSLPLGWVVTGAVRDVQQKDPRYPVVGFQLTRGEGHHLTVVRESCRFLGVGLSGVRTGSGLEGGVGGEGFPAKVSRWLGRAGLSPVYRSSNYALGFGGRGDGHAIFVRFQQDPREESDRFEGIRAELVDEAGEAIPLVAREDVGGLMGEGEVVRVWTLEPAPRTRARFDLRLLTPDGLGEIAVLRLGELGGPWAGEKS